MRNSRFLINARKRISYVPGLKEAASIILVCPTPGDPQNYSILFAKRRTRFGSQYLNAHIFPGGQFEHNDRLYPDDHLKNLKLCARRKLNEEWKLQYQSVEDEQGRFSTRLIRSKLGPLLPMKLAFFKGAEAEKGFDLMVPWTRWITPETVHRRYDTWFFLVCCTDMITEDENGRSSFVREPNSFSDVIQNAEWLSASEALNHFDNGLITLFPSQWYILNDLRIRFPNFSSLLSVASDPNTLSRPTSRLPIFAPQVMSPSKKGFTMVLPGDYQYKYYTTGPLLAPSDRHRLFVSTEGRRPTQVTMEKSPSRAVDQFLIEGRTPWIRELEGRDKSGEILRKRDTMREIRKEGRRNWASALKSRQYSIDWERHREKKNDKEWEKILEELKSQMADNKTNKRKDV